MQVKRISAKAGMPSTFWSTDGQNWYTTKAAAEKNDTTSAVNPEDYRCTKNWFSKNWNWLITYTIDTIIIAAVIYLYIKTLKNK